ncbi:hypothetical protein [Paenibacillus agricola]|uniref:Uncharacterized protein n=1 Tax=Paenibacillus agricola TaxID=2716264 RepID=A0ABX0JKD4_9BACL|nr:hypothetical protein [Paenibacillus agricola]NHN35607.1 hypothetical protein [Paenibacillus agricola]
MKLSIYVPGILLPFFKTMAADLLLTSNLRCSDITCKKDFLRKKEKDVDYWVKKIQQMGYKVDLKELNDTG